MKNDKKTPPALDFDYLEKVIVYQAFKDKLFFSDISEKLDIKYIQNKDYKNFYQILHSYFEKNKKLPSISELPIYCPDSNSKESLKKVLTEFKDKFTKESPYSNNKEELYSVTERYLKERGIFYVLSELADEFSTGNIQYEQAQKKMEKACNVSLLEDLGHWYYRDFNEHVKYLQEEKVIGIPTGWNWLDKEVLGGGLWPRGLTIIGGGTNTGKSLVLGQLAGWLSLSGKKVLLVTLEISKEVYASRISSQLSKIPFRDLKNQITNLGLFVQDLKNNKNPGEIIIKEYAARQVSVGGIDNLIEKIILAGFEPDVIIVDYLTLLRPVLSRGMNSYEQGKEFAEGLRGLGFKYNKHILSGCQINRSGISLTSPGLDSLAESMAIAHTADCMINIWFESEEFKELGILSAGVKKNRYGKNFGNCKLQIDYENLSLKETNNDLFDKDDPNKIEQNYYKKDLQDLQSPNTDLNDLLESLKTSSLS